MADAADADRGSRDPELPAWLRAKVETAWNGNGSDRRNQVQSLCRQYPGFVTAIERYVDGIRESDERPTSPPEPATRPVVVLDPLPAAGGPLAERIGPYMVRKKLGEGAFGEVFLADQHHPLRRTVAIKLIRPGMDSDEVVARFTAEREVLALMDHPNIAKIFDAGTDAQKRPYFVMEYVQGEPITRYASDRDLDVDARLRLFRQVCDGIQHAHQKGIIHRDLSARNVLVTEIDGRPTPKVIDFGIAKSMLRPLGDGDVRTLKWQIFGTPEYMSPEQARSSGMDIDVRTDVYALGVLLYELLTGTLPVPSETLRSASPLEWCELIRDAQPPLPSRRAHDARSQLPGLAPRTAALVRRLQGDLDWIVRKAMEPDRAHRYGSAAELAADLDRHLHDEPVTARQPTAGYRLRKFVRKHKTAVLTATAGLCGLLVALIVITRLYLSAEDARGAARRNEQLAAERLEEVLQLADVQRLAELRESAETKLWPAERETVPAMEQWLVEVAALRERLTEHRAQLTKLRTEALPGESTGRVEFRFADTERQWRHDTLQGLVAGIESLVGANGGPSLLAAIETRLAFARDVERRSLVEPAALWQSTIAALGSDPYRARHANVRLTPQLGLVPLGPDPDSGLFEFAHLQTGEVPVRGRDGRLTRTEDTGLVFVLLPGGKLDGRGSAGTRATGRSERRPVRPRRRRSGARGRDRAVLPVEVRDDAGPVAADRRCEPELLRTGSAARRPSADVAASGRTGLARGLHGTVVAVVAAVADRSTVGVRGPRRDRRLVVGRRDTRVADRRREPRRSGRGAGRVLVAVDRRLARARRRLRRARASRSLRSEPVRPSRHPRQRLGMVPRRLRPVSRRHAWSRRRTSRRRQSRPDVPRRQLLRNGTSGAVGGSQLDDADVPWLLHRCATGAPTVGLRGWDETS